MEEKKIYLLIFVLFANSLSVQAQYYDEYDNYRQQGLRNQVYYEDDVEEWGNFYAEYSPLQLVSTAKGVDNKLFHTATIGVSYDFQLGNSPAFIDGGFEASGSWFSKRYHGGDKYSMDIYNCKVPINLSFRFNIADGFAIVPYGGAYLKYNIYGEERENNNKWILFDDYDTYDYDYNRFQIGYQAGIKLLIAECFSIGAAWTADLTSFCKYYDDWTDREEKEKFQGLAFTIGYCF